MNRELSIFARAFWLQNILIEIQKEILVDSIIPQTENERAKTALLEFVRDLDSAMAIGDAVKSADWDAIEAAVNACSVQMSRKARTGNA